MRHKVRSTRECAARPLEEKKRGEWRWPPGRQEQLCRIAGVGFQGDKSQRTLWVAESNPCSPW